MARGECDYYVGPYSTVETNGLMPGMHNKDINRLTKSIDGTLCMVKCNAGDDVTGTYLESFTKLDQAGAIALLQTVPWKREDPQL